MAYFLVKGKVIYQGSNLTFHHTPPPPRNGELRLPHVILITMLDLSVESPFLSDERMKFSFPHHISWPPLKCSTSTGASFVCRVHHCPRPIDRPDGEYLVNKQENEVRGK